VPLPNQAITVDLTSGEDDTGVDFGNHHPFPPGSGTPPTPVLVTSEDVGGAPLVIDRDLTTNQIVLEFNAYAANFRGGVRVATGDFTGGLLPDIVTAAGPGGGPHIELWDGTNGSLLASFYAYAPSFSGGVYVATGDVNGDGIPDIITGAGAGGGPHVEVFDGKSLLAGKIDVLYSFYAYGANFSGGVRVASADVNGDGFDDIITAAGPGGGPHVEAWSGQTGGLIRSFYAYSANFTGGVFVAAADVNSDGFADIITGPGVGGGPDLRIFNGATNGTLLGETYAFPATSMSQISSQTLWTSGLRVATTDLGANGLPDIIVGPGYGQESFVRILDPSTLSVITPPGQLTVFDPTYLGGIFVAGD
jgi:hypothetical protein